MNKGYYLSIFSIEDGKEKEKINKVNLKEILKRLPYTTNFSLYSYKNNNQMKLLLYLKDEDENEIGKIPILLSNIETHLEKSGKYTFRTNDEKWKIFFFP